MAHMVWALLGALLFILAYAYYTIAGLFSWAGGNGAMALIEFGTAIALVILSAAVMGACLSLPQASASRPDEPQHEKPDSSP